MDDNKHPYDLNRAKENHLDRVTNRITGFIGGGIAGFIIGIIGLAVLTKFGSMPLSFAFYGVVGSTISFAIVGAVWPKWFAWVFDVVSFW